MNFVSLALIPQHTAQCIGSHKLHHTVVQYARRTRIARSGRTWVLILSAGCRHLIPKRIRVLFHILRASLVPLFLILLILAVVGDRLFDRSPLHICVVLIKIHRCSAAGIISVQPAGSGSAAPIATDYSHSNV